MKVLVNGAAGFIGFHLSKKLLEESHVVHGVYNLNTYYSVRLKLDRLNEMGISSDEKCLQQLVKQSKTYSSFRFSILDLTDSEAFFSLVDFPENRTGN